MRREKLEEERWSDVEATLCYVVRRNPLFKKKRMMVKVKNICDDKESGEFDFKVFLSKRPEVYPSWDESDDVSAADFFQTLSAFSNPQDLFDQSLLLDMLFLGAPQLRTGLGFLFFFNVSFMKHPNVHTVHRSRKEMIRV